MPLSIDEFNGLPEHSGRTFGQTSEERKKIIDYLYTNGACTPAEVQEGTGVEKAKVRLDVMRRDDLVAWKDKDDEVFYALTEKGTARAEGKTVQKKKKIKNKPEDEPALE